MTTRASKRQRVESNPSENLNSKRDAEIWHGDGNIIIQAHLVQFRVHRSILAAQSTVFADMFTVPQPSEQETSEDCPVVHVSDSPKDVANLLHAIYDGSFFFGRESPLISLIASILRMSRKYDCTRLKQEGLRRLKYAFPTTLDGWDKLNDDDLRILHEDTLPIDAVNLAHELGIHSILPAAYHKCNIAFTVEEILSGVERSDGTLAQLIPEAQKNCLVGREEFRDRMPETTFAWAGPEDSDNRYKSCTSDDFQCTKIRFSVLASFAYSLPHHHYGLSRWDQWLQVDGVLKLISLQCHNCTLKAIELMAKGRKDCWQELPSLYKIVDWDDLEDEI